MRLKRRSSRDRSGSISRTHRGLSPSATSPDMSAMKTRSPLLSNGTLMKTSRAVLDPRPVLVGRRARRDVTTILVFETYRVRVDFPRPERDFWEPRADFVERLLDFLELATLRATTACPTLDLRDSF